MATQQRIVMDVILREEVEKAGTRIEGKTAWCIRSWSV
jgi:hypothetical protein